MTTESNRGQSTVSTHVARGFALSRRTDLEAVARRASRLVAALGQRLPQAEIEDLIDATRSALDDARQLERFPGGAA